MEKNKKWSKEGITPLMITLLLVSFAVAVGVVVMNLGSAQVESGAQCTINVGLKFSQISSEDQFCLDRVKNQLFFSIENGVNIKVEGLIVNLIGTAQAKTYDLGDAKIEKAGVYLKYIPYDIKENGELRQIKIIPKVNMFDEELTCQEKALVLEEVRDCKT